MAIQWYKTAKTHELFDAFRKIGKEIRRLWTTRKDATGLLEIMRELENELETRSTFSLGRFSTCRQNLLGLR